MAEYYPLLDRAVSGLTDPTPEARRSIYERARTALIGQLSRMDPPVPEEDIARESAALDEAISRVEARFPGHGRDAAGEAPPAPAEAAPAAPPIAPSAPPPVPAPARLPPPVRAAATPVVPPPSRERPVLGPRPTPAGTAAAAAAAGPGAGGSGAGGPGAAGRAPQPPRGTRPVMALRPVVSAPVREAPVLGAEGLAAPADAAATKPEGAPPAPRPPAGPAPSVAAPSAAGVGFAAALDAAAGSGAAEAGARGDADGVGPAAAPAPREGAARPPAPRPREARGWSRAAIAAAVLTAVVVAVGMGFAAYRLRDRPEQVVATRAAAPDAATGSAPGKVADRAASAGAADADAQPTSGASVPAPIAQGLDAGNAAPSIAVAQRAALLVDAPDDPQRVRTYVGTVVWHLDSVSPGGGQPLASAVKADVDIPDAKLKVTMLMQRNPEPQLPASHTIEFHFLPQAGNTLGPIKQVNVPEMRRDDDAPTGDALAGVPVAITENYFLVGLTRGAAESQNIRLITERNWFDVSVLFSSGKLGKLTFEKGAGGQRVIDDALKAWK